MTGKVDVMVVLKEMLQKPATAKNAHQALVSLRADFANPSNDHLFELLFRFVASNTPIDELRERVLTMDLGEKP